MGRLMMIFRHEPTQDYLKKVIWQVIALKAQAKLHEMIYKHNSLKEPKRQKRIKYILEWRLSLPKKEILQRIDLSDYRNELAPSVRAKYLAASVGKICDDVKELNQDQYPVSNAEKCINWITNDLPRILRRLYNRPRLNNGNIKETPGHLLVTILQLPSFLVLGDQHVEFWSCSKSCPGEKHQEIGRYLNWISHPENSHISFIVFPEHWDYLISNFQSISLQTFSKETQKYYSSSLPTEQPLPLNGL